MTLRRRLRERRTPAAVGAGLATAFGLVLLFFGQDGPLTRLSFDLPFSPRSGMPVDGVVVVYLDEVSHSKLHQPYDAGWDRTLHARLVRTLTQSGARAVVLDILLTTPDRDPNADAALAEALRSQTNVVLAGKASQGETFAVGSDLQFEKPLTNFLAAGAAWGCAEFIADADDVVRQHFDGWPDQPSLTWQLATLLGAPVTRTPNQQNRPRWINFYGPPKHLPHLSYSQVIDGLTPETASLIRGNVVFVGLGAQTGFSSKRQDLFRTPYCWAPTVRTPGVEIHATMYLNLARGDWLERMNPWLEFGLVVICGLVAGIGLALCRPVPATLAALGGVLLISGFGVVLPWTQHVWFAWLVLCLVQIPLALFCSLVFIAQKRAVTIAASETIDYSPAAAPGKVAWIPDHELLRRIGSGSYGEVWLARNVTGALRAVKLVQRSAFADARQFEREFEGVRKFEPLSRLHEGLVDILHVGRNDAAGGFYYVMELADDASDAATDARTHCRPDSPTTPMRPAQDPAIPSFHRSTIPPSHHSIAPERYSARTLRREFQERGRVGFEDCLRLGLALTGALDFLHRYGLVHRDIKPSNIIFVQDAPKLADIGLVTEAGEARSMVGTEGYIAPEGPGTAAADIYSLGKVLYEAVTGLEIRRFPELPTTDASDPSTANMLRLFETVLRACAADPARRFASAAAMQMELSKLI
jgi:CHASE2 domain-containing sensor protein